MLGPIRTAEPDDLERFVSAQDGTYRQVLAELGAGRKTSHWMWFVFPQMRGLGSSAMAVRYGIASKIEAAAYLAHLLLGARLVECSSLVARVENKSALVIFGSPDDMKLRSCMTLFAAIPGANGVFEEILDRYFRGDHDPRTLSLLSLG